MGKLRTGDTDEFPVESRSDHLNYILVYKEPKMEEQKEVQGTEIVVVGEEPVHWEHFKSTKSDKKKLLGELEDVEDYDQVDLLATWKGEWGTDTFHLELPEFVDRLREADL